MRTKAEIKQLLQHFYHDKELPSEIAMTLFSLELLVDARDTLSEIQETLKELKEIRFCEKEVLAMQMSMREQQRFTELNLVSREAQKTK